MLCQRVCVFYVFCYIVSNCPPVKLNQLTLIIVLCKSDFPPQVYTCSPSWTPLPPPSPYHPYGSSQCTNPKHPVSCIKPGLTILFLYDIIHVSMPFSQIITPSPQSPKDCSIHLCLFCCLVYRVIITIFLIPYICFSILYWCFSFWLTSLCIIGSSFIHLIRTDSNVFFLMAE